MRTEEFGQSGTLSYAHDKVTDHTYLNTPKVQWKGIPYMGAKSNILGLNSGKILHLRCKQRAEGLPKLTIRHAIPRNALSGAKGHAKANDMQNGHIPKEWNGPERFPTQRGLPSRTVIYLPPKINYTIKDEIEIPD